MFTLVKFTQLHVCLSTRLTFSRLKNCNFEDLGCGKVPQTKQMLNKCLLNKPSCLEPNQNSVLNPFPACHPMFLFKSTRGEYMFSKPIMLLSSDQDQMQTLNTLVLCLLILSLYVSSSWRHSMALASLLWIWHIVGPQSIAGEWMNMWIHWLFIFLVLWDLHLPKAWESGLEL